MLNNFMEMSLENLYVDHAGIVGLKGLKIPQFSPLIILLCYQISAVKVELCVPKEKMLPLVYNLKMSLSSLESPSPYYQVSNDYCFSLAEKIPKSHGQESLCP